MHVLHDISVFAFAMTAAKVRRATYYASRQHVVKMTANHRPRGKARSLRFSVTVGAPNYAERHFIKQCEKAKVKLPTTKGPLLKYWPKKKRRAA